MTEPPQESPSHSGPQGAESRPFDWNSFALMGLFTICLLAALHVAKAVVLPVVLAVFFHMILKPIQKILMKLHFNHLWSAAVIISLLVGIIYLTGSSLRGPAMEWIETMPSTVREAEFKLRDFLQSIESFRRVADRMDELAGDNGEQSGAEIKLSEPKMSEVLLRYFQGSLVTFSITMILVFFFLGYGYRIRDMGSEVWGEISIPQEVDEKVSRYLLTITVINVCLGIAVALVLWLMGMPNPMLWGVLATVLNYVPYLGAMLGTVIVLFAALLTFESTGRIISIPVAYYLVTAFEGNFVTPIVLGRRFTVNPIIIFVWLIFWGWLWGIAGAIVAVPLLMAFRIVCEHIPQFKVFSRLMSR